MMLATAVVNCRPAQSSQR